MQNSTANLVATSTKILWSARVLSVVLLGFGGWFGIAHLVGSAGAPSRDLTFNDFASLSLLMASLVGLGLALKWERLGATVTLLAVALGAVFNWRVLLFPATLIPVAAVLFLVSAWLRSSSSVGDPTVPRGNLSASQL